MGAAATGGPHPHLVLMGVAGSGKTTIATLLPERLGVEFAEADRFQSAANVARMRAGTPLTDEDRWPWLAAIRDRLSAEADAGRCALRAPRRGPGGASCADDGPGTDQVQPVQAIPQVMEVFMGRRPGWMVILTGRPSMRSPGRTLIRKDIERLLWAEIATGKTSEDAGVAVLQPRIRRE